jgi:hypothetical protein
MEGGGQREDIRTTSSAQPRTWEGGDCIRKGGEEIVLGEGGRGLCEPRWIFVKISFRVFEPFVVTKRPKNAIKKSIAKQ